MSRAASRRVVKGLWREEEDTDVEQMLLRIRQRMEKCVVSLVCGGVLGGAAWGGALAVWPTVVATGQLQQRLVLRKGLLGLGRML